MARQSQPSAFTLVELLVVIGIIALLIAILLPSLNKARQQANTVDCQSRLHQIGLALSIYEGNAKGLLPWGDINYSRTAAATAGTAGQGVPIASEPLPIWWWYDELALTLNRNVVNSANVFQGLPAVFSDRDSIPNADGSVPEVYTANERVFWGNQDTDTSPDALDANGNPRSGNDVPQYRQAKLGRGSAFLIWDAPQCADQNGNAYGVASELDTNQLTYGHYFDSLYNPAVTYARAIAPGGGSLIPITQNASVCKADQKKFNQDQTTYLNFIHMRFRHKGNTVMNALCGDGHVESRLVGSAMVTDFIVTTPY